MSNKKLQKHKIWKRRKREKLKFFCQFSFYDVITRQLRKSSIDELIRELPAVGGNWPTDNGLPVFFAVCDRFFFTRYAELLIGSVNKNSYGTPVHLHLYNPTEIEFNRLAQIRKLYSTTPITCTWELTNLAHLPKSKQVIYYQSARFIRFYMALLHTNSPLIAIDIDSIVRKPVELMVRMAHDADVGIFLRETKNDSAKNVLAAIMYAKPSPHSLCFCENVAKRVAVHLLVEGQTEMLDQRVLWKTYIRFRRRFNIWNIPRTFSDWELSYDSAIWHGKGRRKHSSRFSSEFPVSLG